MLHFNAKKVYLQIESISVNQGHPIKECTCETHRTKAITWLQDTLLPKLIKWAANSNKHNELKSLQLVDNMSHYSSLYNELKVKYGKEITQVRCSGYFFYQGVKFIDPGRVILNQIVI